MAILTVETSQLFMLIITCIDKRNRIKHKNCMNQYIDFNNKY